MTKKCSKCRIWWPESGYSFNRGKRRAACKRCANERRAKRYAENREDERRTQREWARNNPEKKKKSREDYKKRWERATPPWADMKQIRRFYADCPKGYSVHHEVPLKHEFICGLNILANMEYLPVEENCRLGNKYECKIGLY